MNFKCFARHKILTTILSLVIICAIICAFFYDDLRNFYCFCYNNNPGAIISVIGTLLGAVIGGVCTLGGSILINYFEQKKANTIRRKDKIYVPLYNELKVIHNEILKNNPCPSTIAFEKRQQHLLKYPQYVVWGEIKNDDRYFEVSPELNEAMEKLYKAIGEYKEKREPAFNALSKIYLNDEIQRIIIYPECNFESLFPGVLLGIRPNDDKLVSPKLLSLIEKSVLDILWSNISKKADNDPALKECKEARSDWNAAEENALKLLDKLIKDIVNKYEK